MGFQSWQDLQVVKSQTEHLEQRGHRDRDGATWKGGGTQGEGRSHLKGWGDPRRGVEPSGRRKLGRGAEPPEREEGPKERGGATWEGGGA